MIASATGHRPDKLGGYTPEARGRLTAFAERVIPWESLTGFVSGMALGWDTACALACLSRNVPLIAAVPFDGQESIWPEESQRVFRWILARAARVEIVSPGPYEMRKLQLRNRWMVDNCDFIAALWNGSPGGTANCLRYAEAASRPVANFWPQWAALDD